MALFRGIQKYIALDANNITLGPGSIPGRDGVFTELHVLRKGQ